MGPKVLTQGLKVVRARLAFAGTGVSVGPRPRLSGRRPVVRNQGKITIGARAQIYGNQFPVSLSTGRSGNIVIGEGVLLNQGCTLHSETRVELGDNVLVADLVAIYDTDFHAVSEAKEVRTAPVTIGENAWLGRGAIILPGVTIGKNSVVAAGAVVTKDVPADTVVAGNPAVPISSVVASDGYRRR